MRTTLDIDDPILREIRALHEREARPMGAIVSELLAEALARRQAARPRPSFRWTSRDMKPLVDLSDKEAVYAALDQDRR
ncbi:MAG: CopG family transcriptional regulator [Reyranella sp.]|uniref:CopG family transcriptional regulator n=1 Tax=Reyranella sp. TaxID=1929291 RepID=UPI003D104BE5